MDDKMKDCDESTITPQGEDRSVSLDELLESGGYEESEEEDFFDSLDADIDDYYAKLGSKKGR